MNGERATRSIRRISFRGGARVLSWFSFAAVLNLSMPALTLAADQPTAPAPNPSELKVEYDRMADLVSIRTRQAPLGEVLEEISKEVGLTIVPANKELLKEPIPVDIEHASLELTLQRLLEGFNSVFLYASVTDTHSRTITPRLSKILLLSKKGAGPSKAQTRKDEPRTGKKSGIDAAPAASRTAELIRAIVEAKPPEIKGIVEALKALGKEERENVVEILLEALNDKDSPAVSTAIAVLKELAPDRAVDPLLDLLQDKDADARVRVLAASGLGEIGGVKVVEPLVSAFHDSDPGVRQAAANGLARIGGERGVGALLQVFSGGPSDLHQTAAMAIASQGDDQAKASLAQAIANGQVPAGAIPKDVTDVLVRPNKTGREGQR